MFGDYLQDYFYLIKRDLKIVKIIFAIFDVVLLFGYPIFAIFMEIGNFYVNIAALVLNFLCTVFEFILNNNMKDKLKAIQRWGMIIITGVSLCLTIYSVYLAATNVNGINIIFTTLLIICWILRVLFAIIYKIFMPRADLLGEVVKEEVKPACLFYNKYFAKPLNKKLIPFADEKPDTTIYNLFEKASKVRNKEKYRLIKSNFKVNKKKISAICNDEIDGNEALTFIFNIEDLIINRKDYIIRLFLEEQGRDDAKKLNKKGPAKAHLKPEYCNEKVNDVIKEDKKFIKYIKDYYSKYSKKLGSCNYKDPNWLNALVFALIPIQKILYIYGYDQFKKSEHINDFQRNAIELALNIICENDLAQESMKTLFDINDNELVNKVKSFAGEKFDKAKEKPKLVAKQARKLIPFISSALKNSDPQTALLLDLIAKSSDQNKDDEDDDDNEQEN